MSTSGASLGQLESLPVTAFQYRQIMSALSKEMAEQDLEVPLEPEVRLAESALRSRIAAERAAAVAEMEARTRAEAETRVGVEVARVASALETFEKSRTEYFASVEIEVVHLALAIARKILHREAQIDPMLVGALVQIALGQLKDGSTVTLNVVPGESGRWQKHVAGLQSKLSIQVVEDASLEPGDCVLQTELGSANFGLDTQLKEVEQGFFDVLARRPQA